MFHEDGSRTGWGSERSHPAEDRGGDDDSSFEDLYAAESRRVFRMAHLIGGDREGRRAADLAVGVAAFALLAASVGALLPLLDRSGPAAGSGREPSPAAPPPPTPAFSPFLPPTFEPAPGWYTLTTTTDVSSFDPEEVGDPAAWAANVPFAAEDLSYFAPDGYLRWSSRPGETMRSLPPDGIVIVAVLAIDNDPAFPTRELRLQLSDFEVRPSWEGQVAPNVPEYRLWASVEGRNVDVAVFFGTQDPPPEVLQAAQEELDRLVIPLPPPSPSPEGTADRAGSPASPRPKVTAVIPLPGIPQAMALAFDAVWVGMAIDPATCAGQILRLDSSTDTIQVQGRVEFEGIAWLVGAADGSVWVMERSGPLLDATLIAIDERTLMTTVEIPIGPAGRAVAGGSPLAFQGRAWSAGGRRGERGYDRGATVHRWGIPALPR